MNGLPIPKGVLYLPVIGLYLPQNIYNKKVLIIAIVLLFSGIIGLLDNFAVLAVVVLIIGLCIGVGCIIAVQRKYNNGVF